MQGPFRFDKMTGLPATAFTPPEDVIEGYWVPVTPFEKDDALTLDEWAEAHPGADDLYLSAIVDEDDTHDGRHGRFCPDCASFLRWHGAIVPASISDDAESRS